MIVSHKHKFIFIKTFKTASTATEISISRFCGPEDVVAEIGVNFQRIRDAFGVKPRNHIKKNGKPIQSHAFAREIFYFVGEEVWDSYTKFTVERNPYMRLLSHFYHLKFEDMIPQETSFREFIMDERWYPTRTLNRERWMHGNGFAVNRFLKFENLDAEISQLMLGLGVSKFDGWIPHLRKGPRKEMHLLTKEIKDRIFFENKFIFEHLNYER
jgi:hypothetical protein